MRNIKQIIIKNCTYFFIDMVKFKSFDPSLLNIDKVSFKSTDDVIYNLKYITMESLDYINIDDKNSLYLVFNSVDVQSEEDNGNKYLIFAHTGKNKKILENQTGNWNKSDKIKNQIETINGDEQIGYKK